MDITSALLATLDKISANLAAAVNHQDATIDQLLSIKQAAWLLRNTAGEASLLVSTGLGHRQPARRKRSQTYTKFVRRHRDRLERAGIGRDRECNCLRRWPAR